VNHVSLIVNGTEYVGWESEKVTRTIESLSGSFEFAAAGKVPFSPDDPCQVMIDGTSVIKGYIDDVAPEYDGTRDVTHVRGRDTTGDLVDCSLPAVETSNQTLEQVAKAMCKPFGIPVTVETDIGKPFVTNYLDHGMTCFELLQKLARFRGVFIVADGNGGLVITKASTAKAAGAIVRGQNVERMTGMLTRRDRFSEYTVVNQVPGGDYVYGTDASMPHATVKDPGVPRYRPTVLVVEPQDDLQAYGAWQRNVRAGRSSAATHTVTGWYADGKSVLWQPNQHVPVTDPSMDLVTADRLISEVVYLRDREGTRSEIRHMPPGAFDLLAIPELGGMTW
jgi:prophage tail gpP-like protein